LAGQSELVADSKAAIRHGGAEAASETSESLAAIVSPANSRSQMMAISVAGSETRIRSAGRMAGSGSAKRIAASERLSKRAILGGG
jgi:hypothetical protein